MPPEQHHLEMRSALAQLAIFRWTIIAFWLASSILVAVAIGLDPDYGALDVLFMLLAIPLMMIPGALLLRAYFAILIHVRLTRLYRRGQQVRDPELTARLRARIRTMRPLHRLICRLEGTSLDQVLDSVCSLSPESVQPGASLTPDETRHAAGKSARQPDRLGLTDGAGAAVPVDIEQTTMKRRLARLSFLRTLIMTIGVSASVVSVVGMSLSDRFTAVHTGIVVFAILYMTALGDLLTRFHRATSIHRSLMQFYRHGRRGQDPELIAELRTRIRQLRLYHRMRCRVEGTTLDELLDAVCPVSPQGDEPEASPRGREGIGSSQVTAFSKGIRSG